MRTATQHIIRIATVLALTAASTSAFAQSEEYRRGYDDGYTAGQRAAHDDRGRGPDRNRLRIMDAAYGHGAKTCDARRAVRDQVEANRGVIVANNRLCGDPSPRVAKRLTIDYRCGDGQPLRVVMRETETMRLSCRRG